MGERYWKIENRHHFEFFNLENNDIFEKNKKIF